MPSVDTKSSITRGKPHGRSYRARVAQQRRRSILFTGAAALSIALGTAVGVASLTGVDLAGAAAVQAQSLADLLKARSPGERMQGQLSNTKHKPLVLAERDAAPEIKSAPKTLAEALAPVPATVTIEAPPQVPQMALVVPPPPGVVVLPGGGIVPPPPGGTSPPPPGGPPSQPPENPPPPPNQPPPLPEPGTWMSMILGFGVAGWALRRAAAKGQLSGLAR